MYLMRAAAQLFMQAIVVIALLASGHIRLAVAQVDPAKERIRRIVVPSQVVTRTQLPPSVSAAISRSDAVIVGSSVTDSTPTVAAVDNNAQVVSPATTSFTLHRGQFLAASIAGSAVAIKKVDAPVAGDTVSVNSFFALPERIIGLAADSDLVYLRPAYLPQGALRYVPSLALFRGGFSIGLEDSVRTRERRELSGPFRFQFGGDAESFDPRELDVNHTNLPLNAVTVLAKDPADSLLVRIVTAADVRGTSVWMRAVPALVLGLLPETAQGLGLQRIPVTVSILGTRKPMWVKLSTDKGSFDRDSVMVGSGRITTVSWRTQGLGAANVLAHAEGGVDDAPGRVNFIFPFVFLLMSVLGGAAGATLKALRRLRSKPHPMLPAIVIGMLGGVIAAVLYYAIGVSIFKVDVNVPFFNEAAVFSLGVLAGLLGISLTGSESRT